MTARSRLVVFGNDDTIDEEELGLIENPALEDGVVDDGEARLLRNLFARVDRDHPTEAIWGEIQKFRTENGIRARQRCSRIYRPLFDCNGRVAAGISVSRFIG